LANWPASSVRSKLTRSVGHKLIVYVDLFIAPSIWLLQHFAVERGDAMFVPFYSTVFLAFESGNVIGLRMMKMMSGGSGSHDEAHLMVKEKVHAMFEAGASLMAGGTASSVVDLYREHVAANAKRLSH
jgi:hypothetical protein